MLPAGEPFTVGVEEEFQIVDAGTRELRPRSAPVLASARDLGDAVQPELTAAQVETVSPVCETLADVRRELTRLRARVMAAAVANDSRVAALGTHPVTDWLGQGVFPRERYETLAEDFQHLALEQQICGFHVHVCVRDAEAAIAVMDRVRPWLAVVLALTGNSPYWQGLDTGYASYRSVLFDRWPLTGTPPHLGSRGAYDDLVAELVAAGVVPDASKIYWELRPSARFDTVEFRTADVCLTVDEAVMVAGLARALVRTAYAELAAGVPVAQPHPELLRAARWRAARYGLQGPLIDVTR
ncbi:MAG: glutamate--cysteine ligase, partial [Actinomycetota bacterium]|nr:glutamate--cysteine ligase [Actinomycetota bacterium]